MSESSGDETATTVKPQDAGGVTTRRRRKEMLAATDPSGEPRVIRHQNLKLPTFSPDDPELWFALLEAQFDTYGITDDVTKYNAVLTNLDITHSKYVKDVIINPPSQAKYKKIKSELIRRLTTSHENKVRQLLTHEVLGDRKASHFLRHLQDLAGPDVPKDFLRSIWSNRLPQHIQTILASQPTHSLEQLADLADRIQEIAVPNVASTSQMPTTSTDNASKEIAELRKMVEHLSTKLDRITRSSRRDERKQHRGRSTSRSVHRSNSSYRRYPVCWYHFKFGDQARTCQKPCDYKPAGNATGNQ